MSGHSHCRYPFNYCCFSKCAGNSYLHKVIFYKVALPHIRHVFNVHDASLLVAEITGWSRPASGGRVARSGGVARLEPFEAQADGRRPRAMLIAMPSEEDVAQQKKFLSLTPQARESMFMDMRAPGSLTDVVNMNSFFEAVGILVPEGCHFVNCTSNTATALHEGLDTLFSVPAPVYVFYFSGHGVRLGREPDSEVGVSAANATVLLRAVWSTWRDSEARRRDTGTSKLVLILDCCFSGAVVPHVTSFGDAVVVQTACSATESSYGGTGDDPSSKDDLLSDIHGGAFTQLWILVQALLRASHGGTLKLGRSMAPVNMKGVTFTAIGSTPLLPSPYQTPQMAPWRRSGLLEVLTPSLSSGPGGEVLLTNLFTVMDAESFLAALQALKQLPNEDVLKLARSVGVRLSPGVTVGPSPYPTSPFPRGLPSHKPRPEALPRQLQAASAPTPVGSRLPFLFSSHDIVRDQVVIVQRLPTASKLETTTGKKSESSWGLGTMTALLGAVFIAAVYVAVSGGSAPATSRRR